MSQIIDGRFLAETIYADLQHRVEKLKQRNITPTLAVILVGDDKPSQSYVRQKQKAAEKIGAGFILKILDNNISSAELKNIVNCCNVDPSIHGIIVQLPLPVHISEQEITTAVASTKDVDGFLPNSPFSPPIANALISILHYALCGNISNVTDEEKNIPQLIQNKKIVIIGRGKTAGQPIADKFTKLQIPFSVLHSQTTDKTAMMRQADILISAVGKSGIITKNDVKPGAIVISVGMHSDVGKLTGDFDDSEISQIAASYTPTPGGVGPVNVASLWQNVVLAAENTSNR